MADGWLVQWVEHDETKEAIYLRDRKWAADQRAITVNGIVIPLVCQSGSNNLSQPSCITNTAICLQ